MTPEKKLQQQIAKEWKTFRKRFMFSQQKLAEALGCSRRKVQYVESGNRQNPDWPCIPAEETQGRFRALKMKYLNETKKIYLDV